MEDRDALRLKQPEIVEIVIANGDLQILTFFFPDLLKKKGRNEVKSRRVWPNSQIV